MSCDHLHTIYRFSVATTQQIPGFNQFQTMCSRCALRGPITNNWAEAMVAFWKHVNQLKEKPMSTEDYKRGVEDALNAVSRDYETTTRPKSIENLVGDARRKLLTKKVTKWVNVYLRSGKQNIRLGPEVYDTREEAVDQGTAPSSHPQNSCFATVSFEIELPL